MPKPTNIEWTDFSWNPWIGCRKISPGCQYCYMFRERERFNQDPTFISLTSHAVRHKPDTIDTPRLIFACSWSDFFLEQADDPWRAEAWQTIRNNPQHIFQILTKRPERIPYCLPDDWGDGYHNVWLGVSVENQDTANERLPVLREFCAALKFVSFEPLLENIKISDSVLPYDWAIIGGESGNSQGKYRYRAPSFIWFYDLLRIHSECRIPVFVKQLGTYWANTMKLKDRHGRDMSEWPSNLQVRQFPYFLDRQSLFTKSNPGYRSTTGSI